MELYSDRLAELISKLETGKQYLLERSQAEKFYLDLVEIFDCKINFLKQNCQLTVKLVGFSPALLNSLKTKSIANTKLRSLYYFATVSQAKNIQDIIDGCSVVCFVYQSNQAISENHRKLISLAKEKNITCCILVKQNKSNDTEASLATWCEFQNDFEHDFISFPLCDFLNLDNPQHIEAYQQFLIDHTSRLQNNFLQQYSADILNEVEIFFQAQKKQNWRKANQIKQNCLENKEISSYQQQIINRTFNKIDRQLQQETLHLKQQINQLRSRYLNPFIADSWVFELQQIVEESQIKLIKEEKETYIYLTFKSDHHTEYLHSYILNIYQKKISYILNSQWSQIQFGYGERGFNEFVDRANQKIKTISILKNSAIETLITEIDLTLSPQLDLATIVDPYCLRLSSRIIFDYHYTQSNWFKLLISVSIGVGFYTVTKLYSGTGRYIGFFLLIFQIINILTGQSIKKLKLKNSHKELQRIVINKYQTLIRIIAEQLTQTLVNSLDKTSKEHQKNLDAIAQIAQDKLEQIKQDLNQLQSQKKDLEHDKITIQFLLNLSSFRDKIK